MSYSQPADVRAALVPGGGSSPPVPSSNTAADLTDPELQDAIAQADATIDGRIGAAYAASETVPPIVKYWSRDIAAYLATLTFRKSKDIAPDDPVRLRYAFVMGQILTPGGFLPEPSPAAEGGNLTAVNPVGQLFPAENYELGWYNGGTTRGW
jgi:hypothetical protein